MKRHSSLDHRSILSLFLYTAVFLIVEACFTRTIVDALALEPRPSSVPITATVHQQRANGNNGSRQLLMPSVEFLPEDDSIDDSSRRTMLVGLMVSTVGAIGVVGGSAQPADAVEMATAAVPAIEWSSVLQKASKKVRH